MHFDIEDVLGGVLGDIVKLALYFTGAIWLGAFIGIVSEEAGDLPHGFSLAPSDFFVAPAFLINVWIVPNVAFLAAMLTYIMVSGNSGYFQWGILVIGVSFFAVLGAGFDHMSPVETAVVWFCWLVLVTMLGVGLRLIRQMRHNKWAREMAIHRTEIAMRRAENEAAGRMVSATDPPSYAPVEPPPRIENKRD